MTTSSLGWLRSRAVSVLATAVLRRAFLSLRGFALLGLLTLGAAPASADTLYATRSGQELVKIDTATRAVTTVGSFGYSDTWNIEFDIDGTLWATTNWGASLATVNPATGAATIVASLPATTISTAIDSDGTMYAMGYNDGKLYRVNKATGAMTLVGATSVYYSMDAAFDSSGNLWVLDSGAQLFRLNKTTGATVQTISLSFGAMSLSIDATDTGYVMPYSSSTSLHSVNLSSGSVTNLGAVSVQYPHGGTFQRSSAELQTLTILGGSGTAGQTDPNTEYSTDNGATWHQAYLTGAHPWGFIDGTNNWINQDPSPFVGLNQVTLFRVRFTAPDSFTDASMNFIMRADNIGEMVLNGHSLATAVGEQGPAQYQLGASYIVPGVNTIVIKLTDQGGWVGINFRIDLQVVSEQPLEIVTPSPAITSSLTASGTYGSAFSYSIAASNSPTSYAATNLPAGLSLSGNTITGTPAAVGTFTVSLSATNDGGTGTANLTLTINKGSATVTLGNLTQTYDGTAKSPTATTSPAGLHVDFSYSGPSLPPTDANSYGVIAAISDANYNGSTTGTLVINQAPATIALSDLVQSYTGTPRPVTATVSPEAAGVTVTYNGSPTAPTAVGSYSVAATTSNSNYTGSAAGTLVIKDTTPPALTVPGNLTLEATSAAGAVATFSASALDNVDGAVAVTLSKASGSTFPLGTTTVNASAADAAGNVATGSFTVTVQDTTAPTLTVPADITAEASSAAGATVEFAATATDAVGATLSYSQASGTTFALGTTTVTVTASDAAGNSTVKTFKITVVDTTAPAISSLTSSVTTLWQPDHKMRPVALTAVATDSVGIVSTKILSVTSSEPANGKGDGNTAADWEITGDLTLNLRAERTGTTAADRVYTITVESRDAAGNATTRAITINVPKSQGRK